MEIQEPDWQRDLPFIRMSIQAELFNLVFGIGKGDEAALRADPQARVAAGAVPQAERLLAIWEDRTLYRQTIRPLTLALLVILAGAIARADNTLNCTLQQQDGIPAAKLELVLTNTASNKQWKKKTNDKGMLEFKGLPDGTYRMDGEMPGFLLTKAT